MYFSLSVLRSEIASHKHRPEDLTKIPNALP